MWNSPSFFKIVSNSFEEIPLSGFRSNQKTHSCSSSCSPLPPPLQSPSVITAAPPHVLEYLSPTPTFVNTHIRTYYKMRKRTKQQQPQQQQQANSHTPVPPLVEVEQSRAEERQSEGAKWHSALVASVALLVYANSVTNNFVFDDQPAIVLNNDVLENTSWVCVSLFLSLSLCVCVCVVNVQGCVYR